MRLQSLVLSLLLVITVGSLARADEPRMGSAPKIILEKLNRLKKEFKTTPLFASVQQSHNLGSSPLPQDLDKSQLVQEVLSQNAVTPPTASKPTLLQSLYVKPEGILIYLIGDDPIILIDANKEPGMVHIKLQGTLVDPRFKLSQLSKKADSPVDSVQVNQISTQPAIAEIILKTDHKNWQFTPRQGGFILTQLETPANSATRSQIDEQTSSVQPSPPVNETVLTPDAAVSQATSSPSNLQNPLPVETPPTAAPETIEKLNGGEVSMRKLNGTEASIESLPISRPLEETDNESILSANPKNLNENPVPSVPIIKEDLTTQQPPQTTPTLPDIKNSTLASSESSVDSPVKTEQPVTETAQTLVEKNTVQSQTSSDNIDQSTPDNNTPQPPNTDNPLPSNDEKNSLQLSSEIAIPLSPLQLPPTQLINLETANVLPQGSILTTYGSHIFSKGQYGGGTGLQTYNISIEGGVTDNFQLGLAWVLFDDTLGEKINGGIPDLGLMSFAPKFKYQFLKESNFSLAISGSLEISKFTGSYGLYTPNNLQQTTTTLAGTLQLPFTYDFASNFQFHLVPGAIFFPNTINNGGNFYGTFFNIGTGFNYSPLDRLMLFADVNFPIGSGGNAVNNQGQIVTKPVWAAGLTFLQSPTVGVDLYATNALGATPATQVLAFIPNGGQVAAGVNIRYTPDIGQNYPSSFRQGPPPDLSARDRQLLFNGINLTTAETLPAGMASIQGGSGNRGSFQLSYGMSDDAQLQIIGQQLSNSNTILSERFELGGAVKLRFLSQTYGDPISLSLIGSFQEGTSEDAVGLFTTELAFLYQLSPQFAATFNPKVAFFGSDDILGTGFGLNFQPFTGVQLIGEVTPILTGNNRQTIWSGVLRYIHPEWNAGIDLYATNGAGTYGIGGLIPQDNNHVNVGFNLLWAFGGNSQKKPHIVSSPSNVSEPSTSMPSSSESKVEESPSPENLTKEQNSSKPVIETNETGKLPVEASEGNMQSLPASTGDLSSEEGNMQSLPASTGDLSSDKKEDALQQQEHRKILKMGNVYITFSPVSWHLDDIKSKVSDFPMGLGVAYDFGLLGQDYGFLNGTIMSAEFNVFRDSDFGYPSAYVGVTFRKNIFDQLQAGIGTGLIYTTQLQELSGSPILPFLFPFIQTDFDFPLNLRMIYIPSVSDFKSQQVFFTFFSKVN